MLPQIIKDEIISQSPEMLILLEAIALRPSPSWHEDKRVEFCENWLKKAGCEGVYVDDEYNVIYPYHVTDDRPIVAFAAHTDVVFPDMDRFRIKEDAERIYCPGIYDDSVNLANILLAARLVTQHQFKPKDCGILFICDSCEEGMGNLAGMRKVFETYGKRIEEFYSFDLVYNEIVNRAVGSGRFKVTARTEGGHSYLAFGNENAIQRMSAFIQELYATKLPDAGKCTFNAGTITGGTSVNTIAQECTLLCEYRADTARGMRLMDRLFRRLFEKYHLEFEIIGMRPGESLNSAAKDTREAMLENAESIIESITGSKPERVSSSTDCNIPLSLGIPAICVGTCEGGGAHTREEYLEKSSLIPGRMIATELVLGYCDTDV